jgi:hypothetical protein
VPTDSIQETFGQVYVEAMLSKVPSVITLAGSALDHAVHKENAWVVDYIGLWTKKVGLRNIYANYFSA